MNSQETNNSTDKSGFLSEFSWKSALIYAVLALFLGAGGGAGIVGFKGVQPVGAQDLENKYATKAEKDEIWRFMNQRNEFRNGQISDIMQQMARKEDISNLRSIVEVQSQKNDEQIRMLQDQNKLMQELIKLNR